MVIGCLTNVLLIDPLHLAIYEALIYLMCFLTVKFSIKSFRIPELLIDVPETATVGSLKV